MVKLEKILEDSLDSIPSPSPSEKIQIIGQLEVIKEIKMILFEHP